MKNILINNKKIKIISAIVAIFICLVSVGYAFFNDSLTINGVASTVDYYSGTMLPTNPIMLKPNDNLYSTYDTPRSKLSLRVEHWVGDTFIAVWNKGAGIVYSKKTITYTVSFSNPTELPYTNGQVSTRIENNKYGYVRSADATISKTELKPGEAVEINLAITSTFPSRWEDQDVIATVSYELQGETRYFYFIIKYRGWDNE
ncbi:unknown [Clostridium sp. CAG:594]|nr:unknown [Clostridium sp. CAG:594]